ncbi:hypothetical protein [Marinivivus vitaminiproducens]|uniref:hypothetical protein n=1 Tax=Marinivivus vitaminiproducens TaxID=3035935 RepID=UPI0027A989A5|nr:hypothetical protein P4R82_03350 [Geminicoccaceae bacterium SCSIO 64248]
MASFVGPSTLFGPFPLKRNAAGSTFAPFTTLGPQYRLDESATERVLACLRWERRLAIALTILFLLLLPRLPKVPAVIGFIAALALLILGVRLYALGRSGHAGHATDRITRADIVEAQAQATSSLRLGLLSGLAAAFCLASSVLAYTGFVNDEPPTTALGVVLGLAGLGLLWRYGLAWRAKRSRARATG